MKHVVAVALTLVLGISTAVVPALAEDLSGGRCRFSANFSRPQAWIEIFIRRNGAQIFAGSIMASQARLVDGTYSYEHVLGGFSAGDFIEHRFYSYAAGAPGVFTPGPSENAWNSRSYSGGGSAGASPLSYSVQGGGRVRLVVGTSARQAYVEAFVRKNGNQVFAGPIMASETSRNDGTFAYACDLGGFVEGDSIEYRFYHYSSSGAASFSPGPGPDAWARGDYSEEASDGILHVRAGSSQSTPTGSALSPYSGIRSAIDRAVASPGSIREIRVAEGTYQENHLRIPSGVALLGGWSRDFSTRNAAVHATIVDGSQSGGIFFADQVTLPSKLDGFRVRNGISSGNQGGQSGGGCLMIRNSTSALVVSNNEFSGGRAIFGATGGNVLLLGSSCVFSDNRVLDGFVGGGLSGSDFRIASRDANGNGALVSRNVFSFNGSSAGMNYADPSSSGNTNRDGSPHVPSNPW
ncbi:MAG: hypothetical protein AAB229_09645 [Candidatus Hydrogenedentota bacterium]